MESKNRAVQEAARIMLNEAKHPDVYCRKEIYTIFYIVKRLKIIVNNDKTPYQLIYERPASFKYFRVFVIKCYIKRNEDYLGKFDPRTDEGIFLGYSSTMKVYGCYNNRIQKII